MVNARNAKRDSRFLFLRFLSLLLDSIWGMLAFGAQCRCKHRPYHCCLQKPQELFPTLQKKTWKTGEHWKKIVLIITWRIENYLQIWFSKDCNDYFQQRQTTKQNSNWSSGIVGQLNFSCLHYPLSGEHSELQNVNFLHRSFLSN